MRGNPVRRRLLGRNGTRVADSQDVAAGDRKWHVPLSRQGRRAGHVGAGNFACPRNAARLFGPAARDASGSSACGKNEPRQPTGPGVYSHYMSGQGACDEPDPDE
ncbi:hypothetical protein H696_06305 [Fonticula alba]|uniref:Uncharacterized protein n=1 Tax=Fonticula alba TaxID=691883 RepID=A0A058Z151_FONAL|nr:hypothetical protein H696_06305 [Fonticula alba]KCV67272.1 hypothetical protein H696_06305 [Fonticula alba]|eukprot:XP_009498323.1 hypothetical protein H696_06305 [Fonticula alba]